MIFCVEDDDGIRELMIYALNSSGFKAKGFSRGDTFFKELKETKPELILLDIMLPGEDGITILTRLRSTKEYKNIPIIMASAKGTEYDKVLGLDSGADDYLSKPFGMMEMISRVKAVLRRVSTENIEIKSLTVGGITINEEEHTVTVDGERIILTLKEYELLTLFMSNLGRVYTREKLLSLVWGLDYIGETRTVDVHIGTLRTKLKECGDYIETIRGVGYRMEEKK